MTSALRLHVGVLGHSRGLKLRHVSCTAHRRNLSDGHKKTLHEVCLMEFITSTGSLDKWGSFYRQLIVFFPLLGAWGEAKSLDYFRIYNVCCCKAPPGWESPEFEPWAGAVGAGAGSAGTSEQADGGNVPNSDEEDVLGRCMYEYIYIIYIYSFQPGSWLLVVGVLTFSHCHTVAFQAFLAVPSWLRSPNLLCLRRSPKQRCRRRRWTP
jgi:hypothetical protein